MVTNKEGYLREYFLKNKDKYNSKVICELCDKQYTYTHKTRHYKGNKHLKIVEQKILSGDIIYNNERGTYEKSNSSNIGAASVERGETLQQQEEAQ